MQNSSAASASHASMIIEHSVLRGKGLSFRFWHANLSRTARKYAGYIRTDLCPPIRGADLKWYSIIHFDTAENLNHWLKSGDRERLIQAGQKSFESYQFKSFTTGLEGWFSTKTGSEQLGLDPPAWKQNLTVVFALYPTIMLQSAVFAALGLMKGWSPSVSMLVNNLITSSILTWIIMPSVTRLFSFWLVPAYQEITPKNNVVGTVMIAAFLVLMALLFLYFEPHQSMNKYN